MTLKEYAKANGYRVAVSEKGFRKGYKIQIRRDKNLMYANNEKEAFYLINFNLRRLQNDRKTETVSKQPDDSEEPRNI